jgi:hypothetical protein
MFLSRISRRRFLIVGARVGAVGAVGATVGRAAGARALSSAATAGAADQSVPPQLVMFTAKVVEMVEPGRATVAAIDDGATLTGTLCDFPASWVLQPGDYVAVQPMPSPSEPNLYPQVEPAFDVSAADLINLVNRAGTPQAVGNQLLEAQATSTIEYPIVDVPHRALKVRNDGTSVSQVFGARPVASRPAA